MAVQGYPNSGKRAVYCGPGKWDQYPINDACQTVHVPAGSSGSSDRETSGSSLLWWRGEGGLGRRSSVQKMFPGEPGGEQERKVFSGCHLQPHRNQRAQVTCPQRWWLTSRAPQKAGVTSAKCQCLRVLSGPSLSGSRPPSPSHRLRGRVEPAELGSAGEMISICVFQPSVSGSPHVCIITCPSLQQSLLFR